MSIFNDASKLISRTLVTATNSIGTIEKSLDIANHYVGENHKRITKSTTKAAQLSLAKFNDEVEVELDASEDLRAEFDKVVAEW